MSSFNPVYIVYNIYGYVHLHVAAIVVMSL